MTGAGAHHALAVEVHLRPVLVELGASLPTRGLYVTEAELPEADEAIAQLAPSPPAPSCRGLVAASSDPIEPERVPT